MLASMRHPTSRKTKKCKSTLRCGEERRRGMAMISNVNRQMTRRRARQKRRRKHTRRMISASIQRERRLEIDYYEDT